MTYGSGDSDTFTYDNMLRRLTTTYNVGAQQITHGLTWNPNGTLSSLAITDPVNSNNVSCNYTRPVSRVPATMLSGRVTQVTCGTEWAQTFSYDSFGNITKQGTIAWNHPYYVNSQNNQSSNQYVQGGGISYDVNGNLLSDTFNTYTWDPNWGNLASINGTSNSLVYDALGHMVENRLRQELGSMFMRLEVRKCWRR